LIHVSTCVKFISMLTSKHSLAKSFGYAIEGVLTAIKKGRNFRIQISIGVLTVVTGFILSLTPTEWAILVLVISVVLILELVNTAIEAAVDMANPDISEQAKIAKDVSAGAVFISASMAIIIGALIFLPKIVAYF
jgi:diacylglycerol kinase (ATP)